MKNQNQSESGTANVQAGDSPFIFEFFLIQGIHFRCMAYRDDKGQWRGAFNNIELPGPIRVLG